MLASTLLMQFEIELNESSSYPHHASPFRNQAVIHKSSVCSLVCGVRARVAFRRGACGALPSGGALSIGGHIRATACAPAGLTSPAWPVGAPGSRAPAHAGARAPHHTAPRRTRAACYTAHTPVVRSGATGARPAVLGSDSRRLRESRPGTAGLTAQARLTCAVVRRG